MLPPPTNQFGEEGLGEEDSAVCGVAKRVQRRQDKSEMSLELAPPKLRPRQLYGSTSPRYSH